MATCNFEPSQDRDRFIRLTRLLIAGGTPILRAILKQHHTPTTLARALGGTGTGLYKPQKELVFPDPSGSLPDFEKFDISLIFKLLRNCCGLTEPATKWNKLPEESDISLEADIVRIDFCRNEIYAHVPEHMGLTQQDFDWYWRIISDTLCRRATDLPGISVTELQEKMYGLKCSPLTVGDRRTFEDYMKSILAEQNKKLDDIKAALQDTKLSDNKTPASPAVNIQVIQFHFGQAVAPRACTSAPNQDFYHTTTEDRQASPVTDPLAMDFRDEWQIHQQQPQLHQGRIPGFKDSGRHLHSQSLSQEGLAFSDVTEPATESIRMRSQELFQLICKNGGRMDWQTAIASLPYSSRSEFTETAFKQNRQFEFLPNNVVQVKVSLKFCPKMRKDSTCNNTLCPDLHLCRYYFLEGRCQFPTNCKNSHDISDNHTNNVFKLANLSFLDDEERKRLLCNVAYVAPEICFYYNKSARNSCTKRANCPYLHVCRDWVLVGRTCVAGIACQRAHTFSNQHEQDILKKRNLDQLSEEKVLEKLNEYYS